MTKSKGRFERDASNRLCYEMFDEAVTDYPKLVSQIVEQFKLKSNSDLVVGPDQLIGRYSDGKCSIELNWDNWSGFFVTALSPDAEPLVKAIGEFLAKD